MKVGIRLSAWLAILEWGTCPAVLTAILTAQKNCSGSYPFLAQKIQMMPVSPAMPAAKVVLSIPSV